VIQKYIRTIALGFVASFALACIGSSVHAQQQTTTIPTPVPTPGTVTGTDPVPPPPPPHFAVQRSASL
jgi:hypothetical protein